jgi:hypothetical protein
MDAYTILDDAKDKDLFYGVGIGAKIGNNLDVSFNYKKYEMYYDAETLSASVRYSF